MADLRIQGDGDISWEDISLTEDNSESVAQKIRIALRRYQGEWFLNTLLGIPYFQSILGNRKQTKDFIDTIFIDEINNVDGVLRIVQFQSSVSFEGVYSASFTAETTENEVFNFNILPIELS